jgi:K+-transporting ATPase ATPase C chain
MMAALTVVTGLLYPAVVTGLAHLFFRRQAEGSLIQERGEVIGSDLLAQKFVRNDYFWPRPSAAGTGGYDATSSAASNLGPTNPTLSDHVKAEVEKFRHANPSFRGEAPVDMVTASGSGLDPDISPAAAEAQSARVAAARGVPQRKIAALIADHTTGRTLGLLGEPRVNVLLLNLELDRAFPPKSAQR